MGATCVRVLRCYLCFFVRAHAAHALASASTRLVPRARRASQSKAAALAQTSLCPRTGQTDSSTPKVQVSTASHREC
eukprot:3775392-Rhodomonas_salina.2